VRAAVLALDEDLDAARHHERLCGDLLAALELVRARRHGRHGLPHLVGLRHLDLVDGSERPLLRVLLEQGGRVLLLHIDLALIYRRLKLDASVLDDLRSAACVLAEAARAEAARDEQVLGGKGGDYDTEPL